MLELEIGLTDRNLVGADANKTEEKYKVDIVFFYELRA